MPRIIAWADGYHQYAAMTITTASRPTAWTKCARPPGTGSSGVNVIKIAVTGGVLTPGIRAGAPKMNRDEIEAVVEEAHKAGIKVAGHAEGLRWGKRCHRGGYRR